MDDHRKQTLKEVIFKKPYVYYFFGIFIGYFLLNAWINQLHVTGLGILDYRTSYLVPFLFFLFVVPGLVALNINLVIHKFGELKVMSKKGQLGTGSVGIFGITAGLIGGACPGCLVGLFPALLGLFGIAGTSLSVLPFNGLEIQAASVGLLLVGGYYLTKPVVCNIDFSNKVEQKLGS
jgi:hypothetical protein